MRLKCNILILYPQTPIIKKNLYSYVIIIFNFIIINIFKWMYLKDYKELVLYNFKLQNSSEFIYLLFAIQFTFFYYT